MVFFTCNVCGEALKKDKVDRHCMQKCRDCEYLSCVDCGKDFWGDDYRNHTSCISEEEKYSGKNFQPRKAEGSKQNSWIEQIQAAIEEGCQRSHLKQYMETLRKYSNIPRKKPKFENFMKSCLKLTNAKLLAEIWDLIQKHGQPPAQDNASNGVTNGNEEPESAKPKIKRKPENDQEDPSPHKKMKTTNEEESKFKWTKAITKALQGKEEQKMSIKKLRKAVIAAYRSHLGDTDASEDELAQRFDKKLDKHKKVTVDGKKVKLIA